MADLLVGVALIAGFCIGAFAGFLLSDYLIGKIRAIFIGVLLVLGVVLAILTAFIASKIF